MYMYLNVREKNLITLMNIFLNYLFYNIPFSLEFLYLWVENFEIIFSVSLVIVIFDFKIRMLVEPESRQ